MEKEIITPLVALKKAQRWCAYQERCQQELRDKLYEWGLWPEAIENIIAALIEGNFLNEERYAKAFAGGKFRIKKWGKVRIRLELKRRGLTDYCINKGLSEINSTDYRKTLKKLIEEKKRQYRQHNPITRNYKAVQFAVSKGYEPDLAWEVLRSDR